MGGQSYCCKAPKSCTAGIFHAYLKFLLGFYPTYSKVFILSMKIQMFNFPSAVVHFLALLLKSSVGT